MTKTKTNVKMTLPEGGTATRNYHQYIESFARLGKEIKISPKANITVNKPGFKTEFFVKSINICIGIGKDYTADLIMEEDAWKALLSGEKISITTTEEFKKKYVYKIRK
jgi:hypothetical protein